MNEQQQKQKQNVYTSSSARRGQVDGYRGHPPAELTEEYLVGYKEGSKRRWEDGLDCECGGRRWRRSPY